MPLVYPPFAASTRIQDAFKNQPTMKRRESGPGVVLVQTALLELGYKLPISTRKTGKPDGIYGDETHAVVLKFQTDKKLKHDGIAGHNTIEKLDQLMLAKSGKNPTPSPPVAPPAPPVIPPNRDYKIGADDPTITPDPGSGVWGAKSAELSYIALKEILTDSSFLGAAVIAIGDDAVKHLVHYFNNTGRSLTIDLEGMVDEVPTAKKMLEFEVDQAKAFVETLPPGTHQITSRTAESSYNYKDESKNWYFAVGGYSVWGKGVATVRDTPTGKEYTLQFEYKFFDRYNWDKGKAVTIAGITITDAFMGEFHKQGLAREYDEIGSLRRTFQWKHGGLIPPGQFNAPGSRS
ncbi:MAG: peptidoglycan-binding protein [Bryobacterales bacterium]|nr:peptidoglycan-binding protein [Bryobacterales bacterium]